MFFWRKYLMKLAHVPVLGKLARRLAGLGLASLYGKLELVKFHSNGYISPTARLDHANLSCDGKAYIGDNVLFYRDHGGGSISLGKFVHLHENTLLQTGDNGSITIGSGTHIQPRCQFSAYVGDIVIGDDVEIAPNCGFYPYNHQMDPASSIRSQPVFSTTGIEVGDEAWIGFGVVLLDGAKIGRGAVVAAGAVVAIEVPDFAIAAGVPARVVSSRDRHKTTGEN